MVPSPQEKPPTAPLAKLLSESPDPVILSKTGLVNLVSGRDSETLINYLDQNLIVLKEKLNETNFERILSVIWESSAQSLSDTIQMSIEVNILLMR